MIEEEFCNKCISTKFWRNCDGCGGDGYMEKDFGDDIVFDIHFVTCDTCDGKGGHYQCLNCDPLLQGEEL